MNSVNPVSLVQLGTAAVGAWVLWLILRMMNRQVRPGPRVTLRGRAALTCRKPFDPLPVIGHLWHYGLRDRHSQAEWTLDALKHFDHKTWMLRIPGIIPRGHMVSDPA